MDNHRGLAARTRTACRLLAAWAAVVLVGVSAHAQDGAWTINEHEYFEKPAANVFVFSSEYNGMFFDEKTAGIELVLHETRIATGGAVRLRPTPEQWDQIPTLVERKVDREGKTIEVRLRYAAFDFDSRVIVKAEGDGVRITVQLDQPVPTALEGRAGLNLEFLPSKYFDKTYLMDGRPAVFGRYPSGPSEVRPVAEQVRQFEGYTTFEDRGRREYVDPRPVAAGKTLVLAPEDPERHVTVRAVSGELQLLDGRNVAQNGWFVVRSLLQPKTTGTVAEFWPSVPPTVCQGPVMSALLWTRTRGPPSQDRPALVAESMVLVSVPSVPTSLRNTVGSVTALVLVTT